MFGVEQKNRKLIQTIDANSTKQEDSFAIERILNEIMEQKKHNSLVMREIIVFKLRQKFEKLLAEQKAEEERLAREQEEADLLAAQALEEPEVVAAPVETTKKGKRGAAEKTAEPEPKAKDTKEVEKPSS